MAGNDDRTERRIASCQCGAVTLELAGKPIVAATCYCHSCQAAGKEFAALPGAPAVVGADGGTPFVRMRKDRLTWLSGSDRLGEHRLTPDSPTRRFVTRCCNSDRTSTRLNSSHLCAAPIPSSSCKQKQSIIPLLLLLF